ncbi:ATP-binding protein [Haloactinospora alba]|nr:ATP-binding protein [Haloactinospora alba]
MPTAVPIAREFTRRTLEHLPQREAADNAELIVSELVNNAIGATGITANTSLADATRYHLIRLTLTLRREVLLIDVWDGQNGQPTLTAPEDDAKHGRGLLLVDAPSQDWARSLPLAVARRSGL